ncbi:hypothetical protein GGS23DRAFT_596687 [Durotheca rogersii]|uniref:uncharacterized protein n=1 Tax=Durotheca rogersii TaxID=419775 RepID=UPI00221FBF35|nr:uncharacterized protein GGS23DRAFT_596687 [Durotheca rogersii]KAI5863513.1 hypothetical protein GGS23DRAFT_596687 [Durotheca rogersii]
MPPSTARSRFRADLNSATEKHIENVVDIKKGDVDDEITFKFSHPHLAGSPIEISVQAQEVGGYPHKHIFLPYTSSDVPPAFGKILSESMFETQGMDVEHMLTHLSQTLRAGLENATSTPVGETNIVDLDTQNPGDDEGEDEDDDLFPTSGDDEGGDWDEWSAPQSAGQKSELNERMRRDLLAVYRAGFHPGRVYHDSQGGETISISMRVKKLSLSKETLEAWDLAASDYIVLLIRYKLQYAPFEVVLQQPVGLLYIDFCVRKCPNKKPSQEQATAAFGDTSAVVGSSLGLSPLWISKSIEGFMNNEFASLLKLRHRHRVSWDSAKEMMHLRLGAVPESNTLPPGGSPQPKDTRRANGKKAKVPSFLAEDHLLSNGEISLPLVAAQFALHYLVRCTDYCTVCHRKVEGNFEALRPYVCGGLLCLHQYLNLGFGPSIEYEIVNQPYVVDLLVSFCYASLYCHSLADKKCMREFPQGLSLQVPKIALAASSWLRSGRNKITSNDCTLIDPVDILFNWGTSTANIGPRDVDLQTGQWVVIATEQSAPDSKQAESEKRVVLHHARINSRDGTTLWLHLVSHYSVSDHKMLNDIPKEGQISAQLVLYDDMGSLGRERDQAFSMLLLLTALPPISQMRGLLMHKTLNSLAASDQIPPSAVDLLRWIVASNRSYIVQVDELSGADGPAGGKPSRRHERIFGVEGWIQFRFAQGSPEKESLFNDVLSTVDKPHKSIVAWHGSPLENWHSIIRQGLNYDVSLHGRAFGDGIYFSRSFDYSLYYSKNPEANQSAPQEMMWPGSELKVCSAISLNELVNLPERFTARTPCYVVQCCHWTQCRYLFVRPAPLVEEDGGRPRTQLLSKTRPARDYESFIQDPSCNASGPAKSGTTLSIPLVAISWAQSKREKSKRLSGKEPEMESSDEDEEDRKFFLAEDTDCQDVSTDKTDFRPGTLDLSSLPQLPLPSYATELAQRALGPEIKRLEKIQSTTPLHELGWYIDFGNMNNMFQWIVELHSFDPGLPLAQDMKSAGLTSIVLEFRFLRSYPMSPPFVRVIRPRFLSFMNGGGGHVTSGGAMCMELLTNSGWSPANSLEAVLLQVRMAICNTVPQPARLQRVSRPNPGDYSIAEAISAYTRAARLHGWEVPQDLRDAEQ